MPSASKLLGALAASALLAASAFAAPAHPQLKVTGYVINADLDPAANKLSATVQVTFHGARRPQRAPPSS